MKNIQKFKSVTTWLPARTNRLIAGFTSNRLARLAAIMTLAAGTIAISQAQEINVTSQINVLGQTKPIPVALVGFSSEATTVLQFDLYAQGFSIVPPDAATYVIQSSGGGSVGGTVKSGGTVILARAYNGSTVRRQAHAFADDIVKTIQNTKSPIGQTKIAYKTQPTGIGNGEIFVADFDGHNIQQVTSDNTIVAKPAWAPGRMALYYTSYARGNPDIFYHNLSSGQRNIIASYSGLNTSAAVSPDGSKIAMVLSKSGSPNIWVCNADGSDLRHVTTGIEDSSPTWSPDGQWICFATKKNARRRLAKVSASGGQVEMLNTAGAPNPTEPDWSPDGKWIAFTSQAGEFDICVMPADGSIPPTVLVTGQNPSWSPNSRTLIYNHRASSYRQTLSVLDVFTKQHEDCARAAGSNSQPAWAR